MTTFTITLARLEMVLKGREMPPIAWAYEDRGPSGLYRHIYFGVADSPDRFRMEVKGYSVKLYKEKRKSIIVSDWVEC